MNKDKLYELNMLQAYLKKCERDGIDVMPYYKSRYEQLKSECESVTDPKCGDFGLFYDDNGAKICFDFGYLDLRSCPIFIKDDISRYLNFIPMTEEKAISLNTNAKIKEFIDEYFKDKDEQ